MKKLFISQPMKGKTDEEILAERQRAIHEAEKLIGEPVLFFSQLQLAQSRCGFWENRWNFSPVPM